MIFYIDIQFHIVVCFVISLLLFIVTEISLDFSVTIAFFVQICLFYIIVPQKTA